MDEGTLLPKENQRKNTGWEMAGWIQETTRSSAWLKQNERQGTRLSQGPFNG